MAMSISIEIKIVPFGQIGLKSGKSFFLFEEQQAIKSPHMIQYREPQETNIRLYEVQYPEKLNNYIVPLSTG